MFNLAHSQTIPMDIHVCTDSEKQLQSTHQCPNARRAQSCPQRTRFRVLLLSVTFTIAAFIALVALGTCVGSGDGSEGVFGLGLLKRASSDDSSSDNQSDFTKNHLYLIVVFVGLLVVLIMGICLSAWCCRGSFENPLCCPCYLCACCGGLACLECIGCGLCAEGIDQM